MKNRNVFIYAIVLILLVATALFYYGKNKTNPEGEYISSKENAENYIMDKYNDGFITYNGMELIHYGTDMEQKWVLTIDEDEAALSVNENYILIFAAENNKLYLIKDGELQYEIKTNKDLRTASVNKNGYVAALTSDKGYKGQCSIYDNTGSNLAEYSYGEKYILGAHLASDNKSLILNVVEDNEGNFSSKLLFMDLKKGEIKSEVPFKKVLSYLNLYKDKIFAGTEDNFSCFDKKGRLLWEHSYDSGSALFAGFDGRYVTLVLKTKENFGGNEVLTFNLSGRLKGRYVSDSQISAFDTSEGFSAIYVNEEILLLNKRGHLVSAIEADSNIDYIKLFKNDNRVMIVSNTAVMRKFGR